MVDYILISFLTPCNEDLTIGNGQPHPFQRWEWLKNRMCEMFGGWTKSPGIYDGNWVDHTGRIVADQSFQWLIAIPRTQLNKMRSFLKDVAFNFKQQSIFFTFEGKVEFIEISKGKTKVVKIK